MDGRDQGTAARPRPWRRRAGPRLRPSLLRPAAALLAALALALLAAGRAEAAPALGFLDPTYAATQPLEFWSDAALLHPTVLRYNLSWWSIAPTRPTNPRDPADPAYHWQDFDELIRATAAHGVDPLLTIWLTPPWAKRYPEVPGRLVVPDMTALGDFAAAAAERYSGDYDPDGEGPALPLPRVTRWEIWNEPNRYLYPMRRGRRVTLARDYAAMVNAAYREIHDVGAAHGFTPTVAAGAMCKARRAFRAFAPLRFLRLLRDAGARFDVVSIHPYSRYPLLGIRDGSARGSTVAPNVAIGNFSALPRTLDRLWPRRRIRIWITEFGWEAYPAPGVHYVSPAAQGRFLADAVRVLRRPQNRVDVLIWFLLRDEPRVYPDGHRGWQSGLRYSWGPRKPAFGAWLRLLGS